MTIEHRSVRVDNGVRILDTDETGGAHRFWARVLNYNVLDDYNTEWAPGVFADSLRNSGPAYCYGHAGSFDLGNVLGRSVDNREAPPGSLDVDDPGGLDLLFELDDFDAVPRARQAWAQLKSGTLREFSVGFGRQEDEPSQKFKNVPGARRITKAWLQEVSSVLTGAVPGTKLLAMSRSAGMQVDAQVVNGVLARLAVGEVDLTDALVQIRSAAKPAGLRQDPMMGGDDGDDDEEDGMCDVAVSDLVELGQAIALLEDGLDESESIPDLVKAVVDAYGEIIEDLAEAAGDDDTDETDPGAGAGAGTGVTAGMLARLTERAKWTKAYINALPDGAFAYVKPGGTKDDAGRTIPRDNRMFPHHNESGALDLPHARNAAARIPQADLAQAAQDKAAAHIQHHLDDPEWKHSVRHAHSADDRAVRDAAVRADRDAADVLGWLAEHR